MFRYDLQLALHGLKRFPRSTVLAVITVALGLSACMTTLALLHVLSADPLPGRSQHLYLAWVDTLLAKPVVSDSLNGLTVNNYHRIKLADARALLAAHRAPAQAALTDMWADVADVNGGHRQKQANVLATTSATKKTSAVKFTLSTGQGRQGSTDTAHADFMDAWNSSVLDRTGDYVPGCARQVRKDHWSDRYPERPAAAQASSPSVTKRRWNSNSSGAVRS